MKRDTVRVPFHFLSVSSNTRTINVSPTAGLSPRLSAIADDFDEYRFIELRFRLRADRAAPTVDVTASFLPGVVDTTPATTAQNSEVLNCVMLGINETVPSNWSRVPKGVLAGMHPWYKTVAGTPETAEEVQGMLCIVSGAAESNVLEIEGVCEFRSAISASNTPLERALAARRREKQRLVNLLTLGDAPTVLQSVPKPGK